MVEGYCVKCRTKRPMEDPREFANKKNGIQLQATCGTCGMRINTFKSKKKEPTPPD